MKFNLIQTAGLIAIVLSCIIALYFIQTRKEKTRKNMLLSGLLLVYAVMIICSLILSSGINSHLFTWAHIGNQSVFLVGPLLYLFIKTQLNPEFQITKKQIFHGIPFIIATIYLIVKFNVIHIPITCRVNHIIVGSVSFIYSLVYFTLSVRELRQNGFSMRTSFKNAKENKVGWLPFLVYGCFSIWLIKLLFFIVWDVSGYYNGCNELVNLYFLVSFIILNTFTYFILLKPQFFVPTNKYKHSVLSQSEKLKYKNDLILLMEAEKAYLNPLISLNSLAKKLSIPNRYLSQVLNETLDKSFYDFINWYRIQDCVNYLSDSNYSQKTILEIAYEVGFNSKSTFNASFTKFVGVTPKEFRKNNQEVFNQKEPAFSMN